jgi:hypothetical protein
MSLLTLRNLTVKQLNRAAKIKARIDKLEARLTGLLGVPEPLTVGGTIRRHRRMSAAARAKIAAAARKRWVKFRAAKRASG